MSTSKSKKENKSVKITFRTTKAVDKKLQRTAKKMGISRSTLINNALSDMDSRANLLKRKNEMALAIIYEIWNKFELELSCYYEVEKLLDELGGIYE